MSDLISRLREFWRHLAPRERILVAAAGGIAAVAVIVFVVIQPVINAASNATQRRVAAEEQLMAMQRMGIEYDQLNARLSSVEDRIQNNRERSNLRSLLESLASQSQVKIASMEERQSGSNEHYSETKLEVNLKGVTLGQTVRYLHNIESANRQLSIKSLRIKSRTEKSEMLDVTFAVSSFEPT